MGHKVTDLVRLTPKIYKDREASCPYWEGILNIHPVSGNLSIEYNNRAINYFPTDCWEDHQAIEPNKLIALVKAVQNSTIDKTKMIAVHCRAGVGRTGTFIIAYALINEIDKLISNGVDVTNLKISIDKMIWELGIQRSFCIVHFPQYLALYKMVNCYIDRISLN